jgi:glycerate dehydrogenase
MAFALILELVQHVGHHSQTVRDGRWCKAKDFCYWDFPLVELEGLTIGLVGFGRIGQSAAEIAKGFGI